MREIFAARQEYISLLGAQPVEPGRVYRMLDFCLQTNVEGEMVLCNTLTGEILVLTAEEAAALQELPGRLSLEIEPLVAKWFLVPTEHDDIDLCDNLRGLLRDMTPPKPITDFTIFTTTDCNARCFYCYEMGRSRVPMTETVARDVAAYILRVHGNQKVKLFWFGGEPLYNAGVIDIICTALRDAGVSYTSRMISNGYLLDDAMIEKAKSLWNLYQVQITLDGLEEVYNRVKAYIYKDKESAFRIVTTHIDHLLQREICVVVRMNLGKHNKEELYRLVDWLAERYAGNPYLQAYAHLLFETDKERDKDELSHKRADEAQAFLEFTQYCEEKGLLRVAKNTVSLKLNHCMMDSATSVTILPDGHVGKCEHFSEDGFVGDIYSGITDHAQMAMFRESINCKEVCAGCPVYPYCIKPKYCPNENHYTCDAAKRLIEETTLRRRVEATYRAAKKKAAEKSAE